MAAPVVGVGEGLVAVAEVLFTPPAVGVPVVLVLAVGAGSAPELVEFPEGSTTFVPLAEGVTDG